MNNNRPDWHNDPDWHSVTTPAERAGLCATATALATALPRVEVTAELTERLLTDRPRRRRGATVRMWVRPIQVAAAASIVIGVFLWGPAAGLPVGELKTMPTISHPDLAWDDNLDAEVDHLRWRIARTHDRWSTNVTSLDTRIESLSRRLRRIDFCDL